MSRVRADHAQALMQLALEMQALTVNVKAKGAMKVWYVLDKKA